MGVYTGFCCCFAFLLFVSFCCSLLYCISLSVCCCFLKSTYKRGLGMIFSCYFSSLFFGGRFLILYIGSLLMCDLSCTFLNVITVSVVKKMNTNERNR